MNTARESNTLTRAIVSLLFTHGLAETMKSMAKCQEETARTESSAQIARVLRSGRFINDDPDKPVVLATPDWQVPLEQFYYLWVDVMDGKVIDKKPTMSVASEIVRSGFSAVFIAAFVDEQKSSEPLSAEALYDIYANGQYKPFSKLGEPARRAWLAVATAIARVNGQFDPSPGNMTLPSAVAALGLVTERFGPPKLIAA